jgi:hypothetical protein
MDIVDIQLCVMIRAIIFRFEIHSFDGTLSTTNQRSLDFLKYIFIPAGSKIVFANGSQDPWRHASKQISSKESKDL